MLDKITIFKRLNDMGITKTLTEIENALNTIDQNAIFQEERAKFTVEIWDKVSPINGIPAEKIIARDDVPDDGEIYLVYVDGQLRFLQPHDPFQAGIVAMTKETVEQIANQHVDQLAWQSADERIFNMVLEKLLA